MGGPPAHRARAAGPGPRRAAAESGFVTAEWVIGLTVLVLPVLLLAAVLPSWTARHEAAAAAAREAARVAAATADGAAPGGAASQAAAEVLAARDVDPSTAAVEVDVPVGADGRTPREGVVTAVVTLDGPTVTVPLLGEIAGPDVSGEHTRRLNPYRSRP
ncbi:hypothetical protein [Euzebya sp.]|uniref:hypothetical protein n=1 Tax=Euzebya sp. TaxID=1971409 RepID=UPI003512372E